jgi:hypothetical protein
MRAKNLKTVKSVPETDTEGHSFLIDLHSARTLATSRSAEIERSARARVQAKEARPKRQLGLIPPGERRSVVG